MHAIGNARVLNVSMIRRDELDKGGIKTWHWVLAMLVALSVHSLVFLDYHFPVRTRGALDKGERGVEIGLKKLTPPPSPLKLEESKPKIEEPPKPELEPKPIVKPARVVEHEVQEIPEPAPVEDSVAGGGNPDLEIAYAAQLLAWLERYKSYPAAARRRAQQDTVLLQFMINIDGELKSFNLMRPSKFDILNRAVEKMIKLANPLPSVPEDLRNGKSEFTYVVPVEFVLNR